MGAARGSHRAIGLHALLKSLHRSPDPHRCQLWLCHYQSWFHLEDVAWDTLCPGLCPCRGGHHSAGQDWGWAAWEAETPGKTAAHFNAFLNQLTLIASLAVFWTKNLPSLGFPSGWLLPPPAGVTSPLPLFCALDCFSCYFIVF